MIVGANNQIACVPPEVKGVEAAVKAGFATVGNKHRLVPLTVVFGDFYGSYTPGDTVYVRSDQQAHEWYKTVFEVEGSKIILVPVEAIRLHAKGE